MRTGSSFDLGDKVSYRCSSTNLVLTGSVERECLSNGVWSGSEPICRREYPQGTPRSPCPALVPADCHFPTEPYSYDFPEDVASALGTSFTHLLGATNPIQKRTGKDRRRVPDGAGERQDTHVLGGQRALGGTQVGGGHLKALFLVCFRKPGP